MKKNIDLRLYSVQYLSKDYNKHLLTYLWMEENSN